MCFWQLIMIQRNGTVSRRRQVCLALVSVWKCMSCVHKPALLLSEHLCDLWTCSPRSLYVCPYSLLLLVRMEKICHTLCFVATCCLVKPHEDVLVVADSSLELRWKFSRTEEHFCWQKSETGGQCEKTWYLEGRKNSCGLVGRAYNENTKIMKKCQWWIKQWKKSFWEINGWISVRQTAD